MTILTEKELAKKLGLSPWTVRRMRLQEKIPFFMIGKRIFYEFENIVTWIENRQVEISNIGQYTEDKNEYGKIRKII